MKLLCERDALKDALACVIGRTKGVKIPILQHVLVTAGDKTLTLMTHDGHSSSEVTIPAEVAKPGSVAIPADQLSRLVIGFYEGSQVTIEADEKRAKVRGGKSNYQLSVLPPVDMPPMLMAEGGSVLQLRPEQVKRLLDAPTQMTVKDTSRPAFGGVYLHRVGGKLYSIGTNGFRFIRTGADHDVPADFTSIILPADTCTEFQRMVGESGCELRLTSNLATMTAGNRTHSSAVIDGSFSYPDYEQKMPKGDAAAIVFDAKGLDRALARLIVVAADKTEPVVQLSWDAKPTSVVARLRSAQGEGDEVIECEGDLPEGGQVSLKIADIRTMLAALAAERVAFHILPNAMMFRITNPADAAILAFCAAVH